MKLTKKIVSLAAVLALSCTFAVSAAPTVAINGDIADPVDGTYSVNLTTTDVAETDQYTVLVYKVSEEGIMDEIASATLPAPSSSNITYINQDTFATLKAGDAYTIAFALGANVEGDGTYKVMVGGTGVATAAVGYFEIGEDAPAIKYGDVTGDGDITTDDALLILQVALGAERTFDLAVGDVVVDGDITTEDALNTLKVALGDSTVVLGPVAE